MSKFYLTTAIAYVNAPPHIGHALEFVQADVLARYHRLKKDDTYFLTGTDEHGVKVFETAKEQGIETQELVDKNADIYKSLKGLMDLSNDDFIRTTDERHKKGAQKLWMKMFEAGDIYKDTYKGNYCVGCESFVPEKDLDEEGKCIHHKKKPKVLEEENYFFKLSKYSDAIRDAIKSDKLLVRPESRKNEILNLIGEGLKDVSFSRPKDVLPWGITVPNDEDQVMYVWGDALSNYITALGYEEESDTFKKFWPCDAHIIGKDILRFHAGIWIGMLMSAGVEIPKAIYVHGFVTSEGQKMSKTLGNVVDPLEYIEKYGIDAVRWYLMREIPTTDDGDFSHSRFLDIHNSELANGLGNLVNRVVMMTDRYLDGKIPEKSEDVYEQVKDFIDKYDKAFDDYDLKTACETVSRLIDFGNKYLDDKKPWTLAKEEKMDEVASVLYVLLDVLRYIAMLTAPFIPGTTRKIIDQIGIDVSEDFSDWGEIKVGGMVKVDEPLFPRLEE
ncbi:methionine--tRNA ligase [Candidatus Peregrinibacteria bacterium]|jgi:methionyl-tRNA synthetase|nr:methionine--tRNA ligase [Candidatus Peregrinibacteria bacterium]